MHESVEILQQIVNAQRLDIIQLTHRINTHPETDQAEPLRQLAILITTTDNEQQLIDDYQNAITNGDDLNASVTLVRIQFIAASTLEAMAHIDDTQSTGPY